jgi:antitoxin YefM
MKAINYSTARGNLAKTMDAVNDDHAPVMITRQKGAPVIMISVADYNAMEETNYLLKSPANAVRLVRSLQDARKRKVTKRRLISGGETKR